MRENENIPENFYELLIEPMWNWNGINVQGLLDNAKAFNWTNVELKSKIFWIRQSKKCGF